MESTAQRESWKVRLGNIVFESNTRAGRWFDIVVLWAIIGSVIAVMLDSVESFAAKYGTTLLILEWIFTILFTIEYALRIAVASKPARYMTSFFGVVDLLSILPGYISLFYAESRFLVVFRAIRLLRIFRVLKLIRYLHEADTLLRALRSSSRKILIFVYTVLTIVLVIGTLMFLVEGPKAGFTSIPTAVYWAIVTVTTVGYGDITPQSVLGQMISSFLMILGYGIIAVPTGIVTVELSRVPPTPVSGEGSSLTPCSCSRCGLSDHPVAARFCHRCGCERSA